MGRYVAGVLFPLKWAIIRWDCKVCNLSEWVRENIERSYQLSSIIFCVPAFRHCKGSNLDQPFPKNGISENSSSRIMFVCNYSSLLRIRLSATGTTIGKGKSHRTPSGFPVVLCASWPAMGRPAWWLVAFQGVHESRNCSWEARVMCDLWKFSFLALLQTAKMNTVTLIWLDVGGNWNTRIRFDIVYTGVNTYPMTVSSITTDFVSSKIEVCQYATSTSTSRSLELLHLRSKL